MTQGRNHSPWIVVKYNWDSDKREWTPVYVSRFIDAVEASCCSEDPESEGIASLLNNQEEVG